MYVVFRSNKHYDSIKKKMTKIIHETIRSSLMSDKP